MSISHCFSNSTKVPWDHVPSMQGSWPVELPHLLDRRNFKFLRKGHLDPVWERIDRMQGKEPGDH